MRDALDAMAWLNRQGERHGDIRNDHLIVDPDTGRLGWIDFDLSVAASDIDVHCAGNVLLFVVAQGIVTFADARRLLPPAAPDPFEPADAALVFSNRVANLRKLYPYLPEGLNELLMRYSVDAPEPFATMDEVVAALDGSSAGCRRRGRVVKAGIARRLSLGLAAPQAVVLGAVAVLVTSRMEEELIDRVAESAAHSADTLEAVLREDMKDEQREALRRSVDTVGRQTGLAVVRVLDHRGRIAFSSDAAEIGRVRGLGEPQCRACHDGSDARAADAVVGRPVVLDDSRILRAVHPIRSAPGCVAACHAHPPERSVLGFLEVDHSLAAVDDAIWDVRLLVGLAALAALALTILGSHLLVRRWVQRPVRQLVAGTEHVAAGDLSWRVPPQPDREFARISGAFNEMSARLERAQRQIILQEKLAAIGKLAAGVAHELNNPLTGVLAFAEDLRERAAPDDPRREDYDVIIHETKRCAAIVRDLLDFARQEMPARRPADLNGVIERSVALVERQPAFRLVSIERRLGKGLPPVFVDPGQIQQVFLNLLTNAAEAMPDGGTIGIETRAGDGDMIEAVVSDDGAGIPEAVRERIFEPFFSTKRREGEAIAGGGQGLGLAVSWNIVERHRGRNSVDSAVGRGTKVTVRPPDRSRKGREATG